MKKVAKGQAGFTLIELIMVIVILGILAVAATSKYVDLKEEALNATIDGIAAEITAGSKMNLAAKQLNKAGAVAVNGTFACSAANLAQFLADGQIPDGYDVANTPANIDCTSVSAGHCGIKSTDSAYTHTANATIYCTN